VRRRNSRTDFFTALVGLVGRNRRRYGGYIAHLGIVLMCLGFAGTEYKVSWSGALKQGQETTVGKYTLRNDGIKVHDDGQRQMVTAYISVTKNGESLGTLYPAKWAFRRHESEPTTEVGIHRSIAEDLYVVMPSNDPQTIASQVAPLEVYINALVNWIWLGFGVLAFGTGIALLPERTYSFATSRFPADAGAAPSAAATTLVLLLAVSLFAAPAVRAQGMGAATPGVDTQTSYYARNDFEKEMQHEIVCTCGCGHQPIGECRKDPCGTSHEMRGRLASLIDEGKSHDEILTAFVTAYGSEEMLAKPRNQGFNRLAWYLPWTVGAGAALIVGFVAVRWSRRPEGAADAPAAAAEPGIDDRLDDELRNLD
jgi:cytochrome c-type biogenesis protein CcmF